MRILQVVHGYPPDALAGTEIYTHDLAHTLAHNPSNELFVLTRTADPARPEYDVRTAMDGPVRVCRINNTFAHALSFEDGYRHPAMLAAAARIADEIAPDVAHVHHLTGLSTDLPQALAARGVPVVFTLHDYWLLCHRGQLFDLDLQRCAGPGESGCAGCVPASQVRSELAAGLSKRLRALPFPGARLMIGAAQRLIDDASSPEQSQQASIQRLTHMRDMARHVDLFLAPSDTLVRQFVRFIPQTSRLERCVLGIQRPSVARPPHPKGGPLRVVFAGSHLPSKAPHIILEAAALLPPDTIEVHVLGRGMAYHGEDSYLSRLEPLLRRPFVKVHGDVPHTAVLEMFATMDALVVPSVWLENSPLVIKEAFACGLPVIASDLGGMSELVSNGVNGLLFEAGNTTALAERLRGLIERPESLERLRSGIQPPKWIEQDAAELEVQYRRLLEAKAVDRSGERRRIQGGVAAIVLNYQTPDQTWLAVHSLKSSSRAPESVTVVDNSGHPGAHDRLRRALASVSSGPVDVIDAGGNRGFSGGMNLGINATRSRGSEYVLVVNSDVVLEPDALSLLLDAAAADPGAAILAPLVVSRAEPSLVASAGIDYSEATGRVTGPMTGAPVATVPTDPFDVKAVSGCVMLIRRSIIDAIGDFDEAYYFSFEDVDLCLRARRAGFRVLCVPRARAHHEGGHSIGNRSPRRIYFATRNHLRLAASLEPLMARRLLRGTFIVGLNTAYVLTSPDAPLFSGLAAVARGTRDHILGRYGVGSVA